MSGRRAIPVFAILSILALAQAEQEGDKPTVDAESLTYDSHLAGAVLRTELRALNDQVQGTADAAMEEIEDSQANKRSRSEASFWRTTLRDNGDLMIQADNPIQGWVNFLADLVRLSEWLERDDVRKRLGKPSQMLVYLTQRMQEQTVRLGERFFDSETLQKLRQQIQAYARKNPLGPPPSWKDRLLGREPLGQRFSTVADFTSDSLKRLAQLPFMPYKAAVGVGQDLTGVKSLSDAIDRRAPEVAALPETTRKEGEILLDRFDQSVAKLDSTLVEVRTSLELLDKTAQTFDGTAEKLQRSFEHIDAVTSRVQPALVSYKVAVVETDEVVGNVAVAAEALGKTVDRTNRFSSDLVGNVSEISKAAPAFSRVADSYSSAARSIEAGAEQIRLMLEQIRLLTEQPEQEPSEAADQEPFDVNEYTRAATAIQAGAAEIRALLYDIQVGPKSDAGTGAGVEGSGGLPAALGEAVQSAEQLINLVAWRVAQLILLLFVAAMVFVYVRSRVRH